MVEQTSGREAAGRSGRPWLAIIVVAVALLVAAHLLDRWAYVHLYSPKIYDKDLGRMLRVLGFLPLWGAGAIALYLHDRVLPAHRSVRAWLLIGAPTIAGIVGELLKLLLRRERPWAAAGAYVFRPFSVRPFSSAGLALPSSHAVVSFAAAAILARLFPRTGVVWYVLAAGCALTRVMVRAHFLSDVTLGAIVGWAVAALLFRWAQARATRASADAVVGR